MNPQKYSNIVSSKLNVIPVALLVVALSWASSAQAAIKLIDSNASNESWNTGGDWEDGQGVTTNQDYDTNGFLLRSPDTPTWTSSFPAGSTLTVQDTTTNTGGALLIKSGILNMGDVFLGKGGVVAANANNGSNVSSTWNLDNLTVLSASDAANSAVVKGAFTGNNLSMNLGNLLGDGYLTLGEGSSISYSFDIANATAFTGTFDFLKGILSLSGDFVVSNGAFVMSTSGAQLSLDNNLIVGSFDFGGTSLEVGEYTSSELNTLLSTSAFSGLGTVSVIPESSTAAALMGALALSLGLARRRVRV